jgi:hypothetical protein
LQHSQEPLNRCQSGQTVPNINPTHPTHHDPRAMYRRSFTKLQSFKHLLLPHFEHVHFDWSVFQLFLPLIREKGENSREVIGKGVEKYWVVDVLRFYLYSSSSKIQMEAPKLRRL